VPFQMSTASTSPFVPGSEVVLTLSENPEGSVLFVWKRDATSLGDTTVLTKSVTLPNIKGLVHYSVTAQDKDQKSLSTSSISIWVEDDDGPQLIYDPKFGRMAGFAVVATAVLVLGGFVSILWRLSLKMDLGVEQVRENTLAVVALGLLLIGSAVMLGGLFAGLLETRGRMTLTTDRKAVLATTGNTGSFPISADQIKAIFEGIRNLRGAALILVVGCVPLLAAAWVVKPNEQKPETPTASTTTTGAVTTTTTATTSTTSSTMSPTTTSPTTTSAATETIASTANSAVTTTDV
jgi:hypothetical protein